MKKLKKLNVKKSFKKFKKSKLFLVVVLVLVGGLVWLSISMMAGETKVNSEARARQCHAGYCSPRLSPGVLCNNKVVNKIYKKRKKGIQYKCVRKYKGKKLVDSCGRVKCVSRRVR